ncbi:MAG: hypothetical protein QME60_08565 [Verrucomicrobiota bacterium]|nr:hypothetical protein [Verrucomicrobiota bacterium]
MRFKEKIALGLLGLLLLVAAVIGAVLVWQHKREQKVEVIDGVLYGPTTGKVHVVLMMRDEAMKTRERLFDLSLAQPVFNGMMEMGGKYLQANGSVRPMVASQGVYMVEFQFRPCKSQAEGLKWKNPVALETRYEMGKLDDVTFYIRLQPPPE